MKIIQSFWGGKNKNIENSYGWANHKFLWLAWMLSCYQLRKFYDQVELYTDEFGYDILIHKLNLPYSKVHVVLDELNNLPDDLWAVGKIKIYSLQKGPFLHVDGDVFIFEAFPEELINADLIAQNQEITTKYYRDMWKKIYPNLVYLPEVMENFHQGLHNFAYNMGIIGGNDTEFFRKYSQLSIDFVYKNRLMWNKLNRLNFNVFFEQVLFYECANKENRKLSVLIKEDIGDNEYSGFGDFDDVPLNRNYLHLLGVFKQDFFTCTKMLQYCWYNHPEWIRRLCNTFNLTIDKSLFQFTKEENTELTQWYAKHINEQLINSKRLLARDLYTYEQVRLIDKYEKEGYDYQIYLLHEIIISQDSNGKYELSVKEITGDVYINKLDQMDEVILYELNSPKLKSELYSAIINRFEEEPTLEEKENFRTILYQLIKHYIGMKIMVVKAH